RGCEIESRQAGVARHDVVVFRQAFSRLIQQNEKRIESRAFQLDGVRAAADELDLVRLEKLALVVLVRFLQLVLEKNRLSPLDGLLGAQCVGPDIARLEGGYHHAVGASLGRDKNQSGVQVIGPDIVVEQQGLSLRVLDAQEGVEVPFQINQV